MTAALPLGVRNRLAELILSAFADAEARATLEALGRFCASPDGRLDEEAAARLRPLGWFEPGGRTSLRLTGAHRPYRDVLCRRAAAAVAMLGPPSSAPSGDTLVGRLARAARLADAGLHFEVHELLEPAWLRAEGAERIALQGLIQAAVALHHASHDNRAGAIALLGEGLAKLEAAGRALPLDIAGWMEGLASILTAWRTGVAAPTAPPWPAPSEAAWRSS